MENFFQPMKRILFETSCNELQKKKLSSPGVLTGRMLPWIEFFFIQKQRSKEWITVPRTARF